MHLLHRTQVALGVLKHINAPKYYPMRLKICSALIRVGFHAKVWIPLAPFYLDILTRKELYKTSNKGGDQPFEWDTTIKVSKQVYIVLMWLNSNHFSPPPHPSLSLSPTLSPSLFFYLPPSLSLSPNQLRTKDMPIRMQLQWKDCIVFGKCGVQGEEPVMNSFPC
jgi:hypothetical protein